jgi:lipopolysaccharide/colanic/teichoic acid biosynthesis glycosyltransferase
VLARPHEDKRISAAVIGKALTVCDIRTIRCQVPDHLCAIRQGGRERLTKHQAVARPTGCVRLVESTRVEITGMADPAEGRSTENDLTVYACTKRAADVLFSGLALILSLPFWIWAVTAILVTDGWPCLYSQTRVGKGGRVFTLYKFRSMIKEAEKYSGPVLSEGNDPRVTGVGRIMRKTAIDEIPQLVSIFRGDMSWVGPRPERPEFVRQFLQEIPGYGLRYRVKPGLTGLAQVRGHYLSTPGEKLRYDVEYIRRRSLWLDLQIWLLSWANTFFGRWGADHAAR